MWQADDLGHSLLGLSGDKKTEVPTPYCLPSTHKHVGGFQGMPGTGEAVAVLVSRVTQPRSLTPWLCVQTCAGARASSEGFSSTR